MLLNSSGNRAGKISVPALEQTCHLLSLRLFPHEILKGEHQHNISSCLAPLVVFMGLSLLNGIKKTSTLFWSKGASSSQCGELNVDPLFGRKLRN